MRSRPRTRIVLGAALVVAGLLVSVPSAQAGGVESQKAKVQRIADQLDDIQNQIGQLDEDYGAAMDRKDVLDQEIADAEAKVGAQQTELGELEAQLSRIAVDKFTSGGSIQLSPMFSSASNYVDDQQRDQLNRLALETGAADADELAALIEDLHAEQANLDAKRAELDKVIATIESKRTAGQELEQQYKRIYADAQAELGNLIEQEQARREAEVIAQANAQIQANQAKAASTTTPTTSSARGGGNASGNTGGGSSSSGSSGGGSSSGGSSGGGSGASPAPSTPPTTTPPAPKPSAPPPSSRAGIAVAAAYDMLGVPYVAFAASPSVGFDCSGLTMWVWAKAGVSLPHQSGRQYAVLPHVSQGEIQPGDLLFYKNPIGHVAIYIGGGQLIHAPATGQVVKIAAVNWSKVVGIARPG